MNDHMFSILIPVYNVEKYLNECINSVLEQTYKNYEVILVDDGSTDNSGMICNQYLSSNIHVIHKKNQGLMSARRTAIEIAKGNFCVFLDSDDLLSADALETIFLEIEKTQCDIVIYNLFMFNDGNIKEKWKRKPPFSEERIVFRDDKKKLYRKLLFGTELNNLVIKAIKTSILKDDEFNYSTWCSNPNGEDIIQSFEPINNSGCVVYINKYLYYYRQRATSISKEIHNSDLERQFEKFNSSILELRLKYATKWGIDDEKTIEKIYLGYAQALIHFFFDTFEKCKGYGMKKSWSDSPWEKYISSELINKISKSNDHGTMLTVVQIQSILKRRYLLLFLFGLIREMKSFHNNI